jgi:hypothetical protein
MEPRDNGNFGNHERKKTNRSPGTERNKTDKPLESAGQEKATLDSTTAKSQLMREREQTDKTIKAERVRADSAVEKDSGKKQRLNQSLRSKGGRTRTSTWLLNVPRPMLSFRRQTNC